MRSASASPRRAVHWPRAVEWRAIVAKAMAVDPEQRYLSAPALLGDLRRFRSHLPLAALPHSGAYMARKSVRRGWNWVLANALANDRQAVLAEPLAREALALLLASCEASRRCFLTG